MLARVSLLLVFSLALACLPAGSVLIHPQDKAAFSTFYTATSGSSWTVQPPLSNPCGYLNGTARIDCNDVGRITFLALSKNGLKGTISTQLGFFFAMETLLLSDNALSESIPTEIGMLSELQVLDLARNQLSGSIPSQIGYNQMTLRIDLSNNQLTGEIPEQIGWLYNLFSLDLSNNQISGTLPQEVTYPPLKYLHLDNNLLTGTLHNEIADGWSRVDVTVSNNQISGSLPEFWSANNLKRFDFSNNLLEGTIPTSISMAGWLESIRVANNKLVGIIPTTIGELENLEELWLNSNLLQGSIPKQVSNLVKLRSVYLNNNHLVGTIPTELDLPLLEEVYLSGTNEFCPTRDYSTWAPINDYAGSPACSLCTPYTCLNGAPCTGNLTHFSCSCPFGFYGVYCENEIQCNHNQYKNGTNHCVNCPANSQSDYGSNDFLDCECNTDGYYPNLVTKQCTLCPTNNYVDSDLNQCLPCPEHSTSPAGSVDLDSCSCSYGYYLDEVTGLCQVPTCPVLVGTRATFGVTLAGSNATGTCSPQYFVIVDGHIRHDLAPIRPCNLNADGHSASWGSTYVTCTRPNCPGSFYLGDNGLCISCPLNTQSSPGSTSIDQCTCIAPGYYISGNDCVECPENFYSSGIICVVCPDRSTSPPGSSDISDCTCDYGYSWHAYYDCQVPKCQNENYDHALWDKTPANTTAIGNCEAGYLIYVSDVPRVDVFPSRFCELNSDGKTVEWQPVSGLCEPTCAVLECANGAPCVASNNPFFGAQCNCTGSGGTGRFCEIDIDDCLLNPCLNGGECSDAGINRYLCNCTDTGYHGDDCEIPINNCLEDPCQNGGQCIYYGPANSTCNCTGTGFEGEACEVKIDECANNPCLNGGTCTDVGPNQFECDCGNNGYTGAACELVADNCTPNPCLNGATCINLGVNSFYCICQNPDGYGKLCESAGWILRPDWVTSLVVTFVFTIIPMLLL